jgi:hypothetical protein
VQALGDDAKWPVRAITNLGWAVSGKCDLSLYGLIRAELTWAAANDPCIRHKSLNQRLTVAMASSSSFPASLIGGS